MKKVSVFIFSLIVLGLFVFSQNPDPTDYEAKYFENAKVIRVKYTEGEAYVKRSYEEGYEEAAINLPVFEKDTVGTTQGRLELYLGRLNYLRLDYDTDLEFDKVPALRTTGMTIRINRGGLYLDIENLDYEKDVEIQTPDCGVFLLDKGLYRINVQEGGKTEIFVYDGTAEVAGDDYSRNLRANQKIVMLDGRVRERPFYFHSSNQDEFDSWNELRNKEVGYAQYASSQYLEDGYEDYEYELSRNGRWQYSNTYHSYMWIPYNVGAYWSPYYHGRWVWNPFYGYVWHSYDSWGWYCHHYGRWHWSYYDGWCWVPGYHWSPAWVSWCWHGSYYGWCPLSRYNRPVIVVNKRWLRDHNYKNGIPTNASSLVIVKKNQLSASHIEKVALKKGALANQNLTFQGAAPADRPVVSNISVMNSRGDTVVYKQGGIVSTNNYKTISSTSGGGKESVNGTVYKYTGKKVVGANPNKYSSPETAKGTIYKSDASVKKSPGYQTGTTVVKKPTGQTGETVSKKTYTPDTSVTKKTYTTGPTVTKKEGYQSGGTVTKSKTNQSGTTSKTYTSPQPKKTTGTKSGSVTSSKVSKKSSTKSKSSKSSGKTSTKKVKKKKDSPSFASKSYSSSSNSTPRTNSSYASADRSYRSSASVRKTYKSHYSVSSTPRRTNSSLYGSGNYSSIKSYKSFSSYRNYSTPSNRSYSSSYRKSSSGSSYSGSYSRPRSSSRSSSSGRMSSSRSSSRSVSRSSSRSSSSGSSSRSVRKK